MSGEGLSNNIPKREFHGADDWAEKEFAAPMEKIRQDIKALEEEIKRKGEELIQAGTPLNSMAEQLKPLKNKLALIEKVRDSIINEDRTKAKPKPPETMQ
jgi:beta-phosphoglucomutase-like phosphatase (HAD superfamily)